MFLRDWCPWKRPSGKQASHANSTVTGVHDLDAYLHSQLVLAVRVPLCCAQHCVLFADMFASFPWSRSCSFTSCAHYIHNLPLDCNLDPQALTLALTLMAPHATLIFKIFLSPLDPKASILRSQLRTFFPGPDAGEGPDDEWAEFDDVEVVAVDVDGPPTTGSASSPAAGFDAFGRRGGVWVRKPRSSRKGSGGE